jgi:hypothetical protein
MNSLHVVTGELIDDHTVTLDEPLPLAPMKVRVTVEPIGEHRRRPFMEVMEEIWARQRARGHQPPTREEVDEYLRSERESWGD